LKRGAGHPKYIDKDLISSCAPNANSQTSSAAVVYLQEGSRVFTSKDSLNIHFLSQELVEPLKSVGYSSSSTLFLIL